MKLISTFLTFVLISFSSFSSEIHNCIPENNLYFSHSLKNKTNITEEEFKKAVSDFQELYEPIFEREYKAKLKIIGNWSNGTVNAFARQLGSTWEVQMFGGLARHPETKLDGFRAVICHEIGHHIAGAPRKKTTTGTMWAANEGQSDYYATAKCLRQFYELEENQQETINIYKKAKNLSEDEQFAMESCKSVYKSEKEKAICFRSALGGKSLARLLGSLRGTPDVEFSNPDPKIAATTDHNHPAAQCRMDTYFQGALCVNDHHELASQSDVTKGYCTVKQEFKIGLRPACWYKASEYEQ